MSAEDLLSRLEGVRKAGAGRWLARCPAHDDRHASLAVRELDDGTVLIHDFAGCSAGDVLGAVELRFDDLFPAKLGARHHRRGERRPFPAADVLRAIERESLIVATAASSLGNGGALTDEDRARLLLAAQRITAAVQETRHA
jgi:hypothetical protein